MQVNFNGLTKAVTSESALGLWNPSRMILLMVLVLLQPCLPMAKHFLVQVCGFAASSFFSDETCRWLLVRLMSQ